MKYEDQKISFIVPYNSNRHENLIGLIKNLFEYYGNYSKYEIIVCEQADERPFMRGQLINLGYKKSDGELIVAMDVDMRFLEQVDLLGVMKQNGKPFLPWRILEEVLEDETGIHLTGNQRESISGWGGCTVWTKEQFEKVGGFTNLTFGWGKEDNIMHERCGSIKLPFKMAHVSHPRVENDDLPFLAHNRMMEKTDKRREIKFDNFEQTTAEELETSEVGNVKCYRFKNITVSGYFGYRHLFPEGLK